MRHLIISLLPLTMFTACGVNAPNAVSTPPPQTLLPAGTLPFAVFEKFEDFSPWLHRDNDTTYVINFWATWCKPCVAELPWFEQLHLAAKGKPVRVLLVSMDFPNQIQTKLLSFVRNRRLQATVMALTDTDYNRWMDKVSTAWDGAIPFTLIYRNEKREVKTGALKSFEELHLMVDRL